MYALHLLHYKTIFSDNILRKLRWVEVIIIIIIILVIIIRVKDTDYDDGDDYDDVV